jgi:hypothetical protein
MIKAILTKPLDGMPEGTERDFDKVDFDRLRELGAVREASALRVDGPTVAEYVAAGYPASRYPPDGFAPRSTPEEMAAAIADAEREAAAKPAASMPAIAMRAASGAEQGTAVTAAEDVLPHAAAEGDDAAAKAAPAVLNKKAPETRNKAASQPKVD